MKKIISITLLLVFVLNGMAYTQNTAPANSDEYEYKPKKLSTRKQNKRAIAKAVKQLKEGGAVLYMIHGRKINSAMLREKGLEARAEKSEQIQREREMFLVKALSKKFKFAPIYFFFQSDIEKIRQGDIAGNLADTSLTKNPSIAFNHNYFLILEFGDVYSDPDKLYSDTAKADYSGKTNMKSEAFVFKNKYLAQLTKPFPFYTGYHAIDREMAKANKEKLAPEDLYKKIARMNKRLYKLYEKVQ